MLHFVVLGGVYVVVSLCVLFGVGVIAHGDVAH